MMQTTVSPPDGGWGWVVAISICFSNFLQFGHFKAFGVYVVPLMTIFNASPSQAAWVTSIPFGLFSFLGPLCMTLTSIIGVRKVAFIGGCVSGIGIAISSLAKNLIVLSATFGICGAIGASFTFNPALQMLGDYFLQRRGFANGLCMAGNALGGIFMPIVIEYLITEYGFRGALLIVGGMLLNSTALSMLWQPVEWHQVTQKNEPNASIESPPNDVPVHKKMTEVKASEKRRGSIQSILENCVCDVDGGIVAFGSTEFLKAKNQYCHVHKKPKDMGYANGTDNKAYCGKDDQQESANPLRVTLSSLHNKDSSILEITEPNMCTPKGEHGFTRTCNENSLAAERNVSVCQETLDNLPQISEDDEAQINTNPVSSPTLSSSSVKLHLHSALNGGKNMGCDSASFHSDSKSASFRSVSSDKKPSGVLHCNDTKGTKLLNHSSIPSEQHNDQSVKKDAVKSTRKQNISFTDFSVMRNPVFWIISGSQMCSMIGYPGTQLFLPLRATQLGCTQIQSATILSVLAAADLIGRLIISWVSDLKLVPRNYWYTGGLLLTGVAAACLPYCYNYHSLVSVAALFGFFAGAFMGLIASRVADVFGGQRVGMVFGLLNICCGTCGLAGSPLLGYIMEATNNYIITQSVAALTLILGGLISLLEPILYFYRRKRNL